MRNLMICTHKICLGDQIKKKRPAGHVARMEEKRCACKILVDNLMERNHLEDPDVDRRILRWNCRKWDVGA